MQKIKKTSALKMLPPSFHVITSVYLQDAKDVREGEVGRVNLMFYAGITLTIARLAVANLDGD